MLAPRRLNARQAIPSKVAVIVLVRALLEDHVFCEFNPHAFGAIFRFLVNESDFPGLPDKLLVFQSVVIKLAALAV